MVITRRGGRGGSHQAYLKKSTRGDGGERRGRPSRGGIGPHSRVRALLAAVESPIRFVFGSNITHQTKSQFGSACLTDYASVRFVFVSDSKTFRILAAGIGHPLDARIAQVWPSRPLAALRVDATRWRWLGPSVRPAASTRMAHERPFASRRRGRKPKNATRFRRCACLTREVAPLATVHFGGGV